MDDYPFGGGAGMLLQAQPLFDAMAATQKKAQDLGHEKGRVILMDPAGVPFTQKVAENFAHEDHLTFICGHYEGYDERIRTLVTDEISMGDYVLTGGELPAMVMIDAISRLLPGVLATKNPLPATRFDRAAGISAIHGHDFGYEGVRCADFSNHQKIDEWQNLRTETYAAQTTRFVEKLI